MAEAEDKEAVAATKEAVGAKDVEVEEVMAKEEATMLSLGWKPSHPDGTSNMNWHVCLMHDAPKCMPDTLNTTRTNRHLWQL